eukprot:Pgem_evm1s3656
MKFPTLSIIALVPLTTMMCTETKATHVQSEILSELKTIKGMLTMLSDKEHKITDLEQEILNLKIQLGVSQRGQYQQPSFQQKYAPPPTQQPNYASQQLVPKQQAPQGQPLSQPQKQSVGQPILPSDLQPSAPAATGGKTSTTGVCQPFRSVILGKTLGDVKKWNDYISEVGGKKLGVKALVKAEVIKDHKLSEGCAKCFGDLVACSKYCVTLLGGSCDMKDAPCIEGCAKTKGCGDTLVTCTGFTGDELEGKAI